MAGAREGMERRNQHNGIEQVQGDGRAALRVEVVPEGPLLLRGRWKRHPHPPDAIRWRLYHPRMAAKPLIPSPLRGGG